MKKIITTIAIAAASVTGASAATKYWDTTAGAGNGVGGSGTWAAQTTNIFSTAATGDASLTSAAAGDDDIFQGTAGVVTLSFSPAAASFTFNTNDYKITGNSSTTRLLSGPVTLANGVNLTIGNGETTDVRIAIGNVTGSAGSSLTINGAATGSAFTRLDLGVNSANISVPVTITGSGSASISGTASGAQITGAVTGNTSRLNLGATSGNAITFTQKIDNGAGTVRIAAGGSGGAGVITLGGTGNTWGETELNNATSGILRMGVVNALPTATTLVFGATAGNGTSVVELSGKNTTIGQLTTGAEAGGILRNTSATAATLTISGSNTSAAAFSGALQDGAGVGALALVRSGTGTTTLSGTNTYTGGTSVLGGILSVAGDVQLGTAPGAAADNITIDGGRLEFTSTGTLNASRNILLGSTAGTALSTKGGGTTLTYDGQFKDATGATGVLTKNGGGTLALGGSSSYTGATAVNNGTLMLTTGDNRLPTGTVVIVGETGTANIATLDLNGRSQQIAGLNSNTGINATTGNNTVTSSSAATLTIGGAGNYGYGDGTDANSGVISGAISLVKQGAGIQTLGDSNTYIGTTTITGGQLLIEGTSTGGGLFTVNSGGAIGGDGTIEGGLSIASGGKFVFSLGKTLTVTSGSVTFGGFSITDLVGLDNTVATGTYTLINGAASFDFTNVLNFGVANAYNLGGGKSAYFQFGSLDVVVVPEPSTLSVLSLGVLGLLGMHHLRRKSA